MKLNIRRTKLKISLIIAIAANVILSSCSTPKKVTYFQDITETVIPVSPSSPTRVEPFDKLNIVVKTRDSQLVNLFNLTLPGDRVGDGYSQYTVTKDGMIDFPVLGYLKVAGMTREELAGFIKGELMGRDLVKDPVVTVEFLNVGFSVMGEVGHPGRFGFNKDQITLLEALSMAGDLNIQGRRDNIAVLRHEDGGVRTYRVDITNFKELSQSPAYYINQDDVIYVEPNNIRKRQTSANGSNVYTAGFWMSMASLLTTLAVLILK